MTGLGLVGLMGLWQNSSHTSRHINTSNYGIGAVLSQKGRPIAYLSKALGPSKRAWSIYSKEMLAIMVAVKLWRPYLLGRKFQIWTDQKSLKFLLE